MRLIVRTFLYALFILERFGQTFTNKDHGRNLFTKLLLENRIIFNYVNLNEVWKEYCFK